jgi:hypothetical protein
MPRVNRPRIILLTLLIVLPLYGQSKKTPNSLGWPGASQPFFISADSARQENGDIRWDAFESSVRTRLQAQTAKRKMSTAPVQESTAGSASPCGVQIIIFDEAPGAFLKFDQVAANAPAAYRGHVVSIVPGFESTTPVSLVGIEIDKVLRPDFRFPDAGILYVIYPQADFTIGGDRFCNAGPVRGFAPSVGDKLLLFGFEPPMTSGTYQFLGVRPSHLVFSDGKRVYSSFPELAKAGQWPSLDELESRVISATPRSGRIR